MKFLPLPRKAIERLGPYPSLIVVGIPLAIVEPMKLVVIFLAGSGHWISGTVGMIVCYAVSLLFVERLFVIVRPKLLKLLWFAALWGWFVSARTKALSLVRRQRVTRRAPPQARRAR
jgi:hypothetical protein